MKIYMFMNEILFKKLKKIGKICEKKYLYKNIPEMIKSY